MNFGKILTDIIKKYALPYAVKYIEEKKDEWVKELNKKGDIPLLSEKDEKKLLDGAFDFILDKMKNDTSSSK